MSSKVLVAGVGMIPFNKPGKGPHYDAMAAEAARLALADAGIAYREVQQAYAGFALSDSCSGQQALYQVGLNGIPIINCNNACASGSTALFLARQAVESGAIDVALVVGFEEMMPGAQNVAASGRPASTGMIDQLVGRTVGWDAALPQAAHYFGGAAREYRERYRIKPDTLAKISVKARQHAANNPLAQFRTPISVEDVLASPMIFDPLTKLQCCPPTCGAAAAVLISPAYAKSNGLKPKVEIAGQAMTTDFESSFAENSLIKGVGLELTQKASASALQQAGLGAEDVDVVELHDCFSIAEALAYESLGLCPEGGAEKMIADGDNTYGGKYVVNPSGGLLSKGHPLGATGLAQCAELFWQLRGFAGDRQVDKARIGLQHNLGLGSACVVTVYRSIQ